MESAYPVIDLRQALLDRSAVGVFLTGPDRRILELSEKAARMFGYRREELIGQSFKLLHLSEEKAAEAATYFPKLMAEGFVSMDYPYRHKSGAELWCTVSGTPLDPEHAERGTVWTLTDISERKRMEQAVRESEERYAAIVDYSPGIVLIHVGGTLVFVNRAGLALSGYSEAEVLGGSILRFLTPASQAQVVAAMKERAAGVDVSQDYEIEFVRKGGAVSTLVVKSTQIPYRGEAATLVILVDISERKRMEQALAYRESLEKQLTQFSTQVVNARMQEMRPLLGEGVARVAKHCGVDRALIVQCDAAVGAGAVGGVRLAAYWDVAGIAAKPEDLARMAGCHSWLEHLKAHKEVVIADVAQLGEGWAAERALLEGRGTRAVAGIPIVHTHELLGFLLLECQGRARVWLDDEIHFLRVFAALLASLINRERSDLALQESRQSLEQALIRANELTEQAQQASRAKSQFLANMSHELRTPLNVILGMNEILAEEIHGDLTSDQKHSVQCVEESGRHLLSLINDILDLAKIEAGRTRLEISEVEVRGVCEESVRMVEAAAKRKHLTLSLVLPPEPRTVRADAVRLKQVLINLLSNAVKFTPEDGSVALLVRPEPAEAVLSFCVTDTGIGIPEEDLAKLFQPFVQVDNSMVKRHGGTGLGLALVRHFVEMHGGSVRVESELGAGSRFTVRFPCEFGDGGGGRGGKAAEAREARAAHHVGNAGAVALRRGLRVLVAEDHPVNAEMLQRMLQARGAEVLLASNGLLAVIEATRSLPDIILMDVQMPEMDGLEATRRLKADAATAHIPVVSLTAFAMEGDRENCLAAGANGYVSKPINFAELFEVMAGLVG